tara:strand:+ start:12142 stop:12429 length:288 start_codon:yes stop_codon:yes gene_type:complete
MKKIKLKKFDFEIVIGTKVRVGVLSSENDEWGDEAKNMICDYLPDVQHISLPSGVYNNDVEGDDLEKIVFDFDQEMWCPDYLLYKDENGKIQEKK